MGIIVRDRTNSIIHQSSPPRSSILSGFKETAGHHDLGFATTLLKRWEFDGIEITYSETDYQDFVSIEWQNPREGVQLHFNLEGKLSVRHNSFNRPLLINPHHHNMLYSDRFEGITHNETLHTKTFLINITRNAFLRISEGVDDILRPFFEKVARGEAAALCDANQFIDFSLFQAIRQVINCPFTEGTKKLFLLSKSIEILVLQIRAIQQSQQADASCLRTKYERDQILFARDYIVQHAVNPPSLTELSRIIGLNEYKLKKGFKAMFNNTVFGYLTDYRLDLAKNALLKKEKTATVIAFDLGYSSLQHFSAAFKKKFGVSPKQIQK